MKFSLAGKLYGDELVVITSLEVSIDDENHDVIDKHNIFGMHCIFMKWLCFIYFYEMEAR